ncbi:MAG: hypothetical protein R3220_07495, partial [Balneolaceae bacterium]|nr:hypothetical protein [Balneolaceae bacterium]
FRVKASWLESLELRVHDGMNNDRSERPISIQSLPSPLPLGNYSTPLPQDVSLTSPAPSTPQEDFTYYVTVTLNIQPGQSKSYQLVAKNVAGYAESDFISITSI